MERNYDWAGSGMIPDKAIFKLRSLKEEIAGAMKWVRERRF